MSSEISPNIPEPTKKLGDLYHRNYIDRNRDHKTAEREVDVRGPLGLDLDVLERRYPAEFQKATKVIEERHQSWTEHFKLHMAYDYAKDKFFNEWVENKAEAKKALHIHFLDDLLDEPTLNLQYCTRFWTTLGAMYGIGRTAYLWRTIDRNYARLHGVGLMGLAAGEISLNILRSMGCALASWFGLLAGDNTATLAYCLYHNTTVKPARRTWTGPFTGFLLASIFSSGVLSGFSYRLLSWKGHLMLTTTMTSIGLAVASFAGIYIYKPWSERYPEGYMDNHERPWHLRQFHHNGPAGIRGRFV